MENFWHKACSHSSESRIYYFTMNGLQHQIDYILEGIVAEESEEIEDDELDDDDDFSADEEPEKKGRFKLNLSRKMIIIIAASVLSLIVVVTVGIVSWKMLSDEPVEEIAEEREAETSADVSLPVPELENIIPLEPFIAVLKDEVGDWELKVTMEFEIGSEKVRKELDNRVYEIREAIIPILEKRRPNALQGIDGKIGLRTEIIMTINRMLKKGKIRNLYFTQFVVM